ncbi:hypothetical protein [Leptospira phage LE3]|uniref:Uncharacterized protein n=2 Tax=Nylescharonvirus TaxID=2843431 RepID=A0A343LED2_9CAUD|nr:hypothetical protein HWB33_gp31 [Leptospira phage LE3]YP_009835504.1 hypothetical protein HWB34_gp29 [Leptospira phage LE4]ATN94963.1 hypothetical protein [Leptospira phage LE3]ATN95042.1 hypothetical protein [Leptospira phage LE4]
MTPKVYSSHLQKVSRKIGNTFEAHAQEALKGILKYIIKGLKNKSLVEQLSPATIQMKRDAGSKFIANALMNRGTTDPKSMISGLKVVSSGKGRYQLKPFGMHYSGKEQDFLWKIHEYGCFIQVSRRMRFFLGLNYGIWIKKPIIKIPARFPIKKGVRGYFSSPENVKNNGLLVKQMRMYLSGINKEIKEYQKKTGL